ncbi:MAG TPA: CDP-diacylglycerol diphosphatase [Stellaceae bacterium]
MPASDHAPPVSQRLPASIAIGILAVGKVEKVMRCCSDPVKAAIFAMVGVICALVAAGAERPVWAQIGVGEQPSAGAYDGASCFVAPRPNSLWSLAQCCAKNLQSNAECRSYDAADKYIILKDNSRLKPAAYLIIPTIRVTGIEDKQIFLPPVVDFWTYGWQQARLLVKRPAADIGLAINSARRRTQNQLHIHIACVLPAVARTLADNSDRIGAEPATAAALVLAPAQHSYRVIKVSAGLGGADSPFNLVAAMPGAGGDMGSQSIAVVGSTTPGAYYVLDISDHGSSPGVAEELLDQTCRG